MMSATEMKDVLDTILRAVHVTDADDESSVELCFEEIRGAARGALSKLPAN